MAEDDEPRLKGGPQGRRDLWYGLTREPDFKDFLRWWHRVGKREYGGANLPDRGAAERVFSEWLEIGRPKVK